MNTKLLFVTLILLAACAVTALSYGQVSAPGQTPPPPTNVKSADGEVGRYSVAAYAESTTAYGLIVVCDTKTGQCWTKPASRDASFAWSDKGTPVKAK